MFNEHTIVSWPAGQGTAFARIERETEKAVYLHFFIGTFRDNGVPVYNRGAWLPKSALIADGKLENVYKVKPWAKIDAHWVKRYICLNGKKSYV